MGKTARISYIHPARGDRNPTMLDDYATYCRAAGMRPATIRLRCLWLRKAATELDLATADTTMLIGWLSRHEWQPETRRSATNALRSFYGWAAGAGRRPDDPAGHLPPIRVPAGIPHPTPCTILDHALDQTAASRVGDESWFVDGREVVDAASVQVVHDETRVLAECEAKRRIVKMHEPGALLCYWSHDSAAVHDGEPCLPTRFIALPYADHPDYREEWRP